MAWLVPGVPLRSCTTTRCLDMSDSSRRPLRTQHGLSAADAVYVAELDLDAAEAIVADRTTAVEPLPRFPSVARDISILVDEALHAAEVRQTIREAAPETLVRVREFDRYQGKGVPEGKVSLSLRLTFRSADRTLTDAEVQKRHGRRAQRAAIAPRRGSALKADLRSAHQLPTLTSNYRTVRLLTDLHRPPFVAPSVELHHLHAGTPEGAPYALEGTHGNDQVGSSAHLPD